MCVCVCVLDCFFKQGEWCFALADYQQAEEMMRPDDPAIRLRLAVLHNTLGSFCFQDGSEPHKWTGTQTHQHLEKTAILYTLFRCCLICEYLSMSASAGNSRKQLTSFPWLSSTTPQPVSTMRTDQRPPESSWTWRVPDRTSSACSSWIHPMRRSEQRYVFKGLFFFLRTRGQFLCYFKSVSKYSTTT